MAQLPFQLCIMYYYIMAPLSKCVIIYGVHSRVGPTGFLQSDDDAKLKIDEF